MAIPLVYQPKALGNGQSLTCNGTPMKAAYCYLCIRAGWCTCGTFLLGERCSIPCFSVLLLPDIFCEQLWKAELGEDIPSFAFNPFDGEDLLLIADSGQMYTATGLEPFFFTIFFLSF